MFVKRLDNRNNSYNSIHSSHYLQIMGSLPLTQVCFLRTTTRKTVLTHKTHAIFGHTTLPSVFYGMKTWAFLYLPQLQHPPVLLQTVDLSVNPSTYKLSYVNTYRHTNTNQQMYKICHSKNPMSFKMRKGSSHPLRQKQRCTEKNPHNKALTRKRWDAPSMDIPGKLPASMN